MPEQNLTDVFPGQEPLTIASVALDAKTLQRHLSLGNEVTMCASKAS